MAKALKKPTDLIQELALQMQLLACLKWLSDFQVLACIPVGDKVPFTNVANLASVPVAELYRVVHMTATAGILCEPEPGFVAHSPLSAHFVSKPSLLDAATFLAETAAPAALRMADATRLRNDPQQAHLSAYALASHPSTSFAARCEQEPKLRRHLAAFQRLEAGIMDEGVASAISSLDWRSLGPAKVVEVGARSTATAMSICNREPGLRFIVQMRDDRRSSLLAASSSVGKNATDPMSRITVQHRTPGTPQTVEDAAVYILHLPSPSLSPLSTSSSVSLASQITAELRAHFKILRANSSVTLVLVARLLPEPGAMDADVEALARMHDLWLLQLTTTTTNNSNSNNNSSNNNNRALETSQLLELLDGVRDGAGRLVVVHKLSSRRHLTTALEVQFRPFSDPCGHNLT